MTILSIAICEIKKEDAYVLKEQLQKIFYAAEIDVVANGEKLLDTLNQDEDFYHIIFLGLHALGFAGLKTARKIREQNIFVPIVFLSENEDYYREAFEVFAFQYLTKPYTEETLKKALYPLYCEKKKVSEDVLCFRHRSRMYYIRHEHVLYIASNLHNVFFHLDDGRSLRCRGKIGDFDHQLEGSTFLRCHKSFYVNMAKVTSMKNDSFYLKDAVVPISRSCAKEARRCYMEYIQSLRDQPYSPASSNPEISGSAIRE